MSKLTTIEHLAAVARREASPPIDVADAVLRRLTVLPRRHPRRIIWLLQSVTLAAMIGSALAGLGLWSLTTDPFAWLLGAAQAVGAW
ncbi:MAG: hypothetical protein HYV63_22660 [Candidatus Schekmanbacteria bacterium]|nr:hypothetical protein [Candidatus Schekmanbacteria bacterium]